MTIVVGVTVPDGIILAADSRTTVMRPDGEGVFRHRIATDNAEKVFDVCGGYAVATFGDAFIGNLTIAGVMAEFEATIDVEANGQGAENGLPIHKFADRLGSYFNDRLTVAREAAGNPLRENEVGILGFLVAGYDDAGVGHICEVLIPDGQRTQTDLNTSDAPGFGLRGTTDVVYRLTRGVDWAAIRKQNITIEPDLKRQLQELTYDIIYPITMQDAIDLAAFFVRTTIDMQRFSDGMEAAKGRWPGCGGPINVIAVRQDGVTWASRNELELRPRGGYAEGAL
jgi:hypothetical protein